MRTSLPSIRRLVLPKALRVREQVQQPLCGLRASFDAPPPHTSSTLPLDSIPLDSVAESCQLSLGGGRVGIHVYGHLLVT